MEANPAQENSTMHANAAHQLAPTGTTSFWRQYVDADQRIEMDLPAAWVDRAAAGQLLELHAPDDPWTVLLLTFHKLDLLRFGERVNELVIEDSKRWSLQRKASLIHNGAAAIEADFSLQSNGSSWMMRKLYLPHNDGLFALAFMTRAATWSRYSTAYRGVHRSFAAFRGNTARQVHSVPQRAAIEPTTKSEPTLFL
jgi:hypothetical protein